MVDFTLVVLASLGLIIGCGDESIAAPPRLVNLPMARRHPRFTGGERPSPETSDEVSPLSRQLAVGWP
jgi:hypothetical protein